MSKLSKNIRHLRLLKKWSQEQLADELDISRSRIGSYEEERCDPPIETLIKISNLFHVAIDALVKCDLRKFDGTPFMKVGENRILFPMMVDSNNNDKIEVVTMKASAGYLNGYSDPEYMEQLPRMNLPFDTYGKLRAFPIKGDSMPPLQNGSYVVGKYIESLDHLKNGNTYVILTKTEGIVYKRFYLIENAIELHSDNRIYQPFIVDASDILEVWEFVCALNDSDTPAQEPNFNEMMLMLQNLQAEMRELKQNFRGDSPYEA